MEDCWPSPRSNRIWQIVSVLPPSPGHSNGFSTTALPGPPLLARITSHPTPAQLLKQCRHWEMENLLTHTLWGPKIQGGTSLVAQWMRICLPIQGTRVCSLVWEDPTCLGTTKPVVHNYWAWVPRACALQREATAISPHTATRVSSCTATKTQHSHNK